MKRFLKAALAFAMVATLATGCGAKANYTKVGLGVTSSYSEGQVNTTFVALGLDSDGKIAYIDLDVAQSTPGATDGSELTATKEERGTDYGMTVASAIGKEWYEQAEAFETYCKGKTVEEVLNVETMDYHGGKAAAEGTDLAAGCTITLDGPLAAIAKAK